MKKKSNERRVLEDLLREMIVCSDLRSIVEADVAPFEPDSHVPLENASIDDRVDDMLRDYEQQAAAAKNESIADVSIFRSFINEADDEETEEDDAESDVDDSGDPAFDAELTAAEPTKLDVDEIDVQDFAGSVSRLIDDLTALVEVDRIIFRRAFNFLLQNYDPRVADEFQRIMRTERSIDDDESKWDIEERDFPAPTAVGAGYDVGGGT